MMKKKILLTLFASISLITLSGCGKINGPFTITCENQSDMTEGIQTTNKAVYTFGEDQYVTNYDILTISKYDDSEVYKIYKQSTEETSTNNTNEDVKFIVEGDDETNTLTFGYKVKISKELLNGIEDKDFYKAIRVLERSEADNTTKCTIKGANRKQLK